MATEPHSANRSVALFTSKPWFLNAATIRPTTIHWTDCSSGFGGCSPRECWCAAPRHPPGVDQGLKSPVRRCHSQRSAVRCRSRSNQPSHHLGDCFGRNALGVKGRRMITRKALKTSTAPMTKQPTLPSRLNTTGTMLISRNFQIRRSNGRSTIAPPWSYPINRSQSDQQNLRSWTATHFRTQ